MARVVTLAQGVWQVTVFPFINVFLLDSSDGLMLVDTGLRRSAPRIRAGVAAIGRRPDEVTQVVLTHCHLDHAGSVARLRDEVDARVLAHDLDATLLEEGRPAPPDPAAGPLARRIAASTKPAEPTRVDRRVRDGELLDERLGLRALHTPGHTPGHLSLLVERDGLLITGDALFNVWGLRTPPKLSCSSATVARETADRLGDLEYDSVAFAHGAPIPSAGRERVRAMLRARR